MSDNDASLMAAQCLAGRVRILNRVVSGLFDRQLRSLGVRASQLNILVVIAAYGPLGPADVSRALCLEKSTLSRDLERLVDKGWVAATVNGRRRTLEATSLGRELIRTMKPAWMQAQTRAARLLGPALASELQRVVDSGRLAAYSRKASTRD